jgi:AraC family transcriptional regulator, activator of mtrCDE
MSSHESFDALSALAPLLRVRPELQTLCRFGEPWVSPHTPEPAGWAPFHLVTAGTCVLDMQGAEPIVLSAGDIVLLPHGNAHVVRGSTVSRGVAETAGINVRDTSAIQIRFNTDQPETELICGRLSFEQPHGNLARAALPPVIVLRTADDASVVRLHALLIAIREELDAAAPGARAICSDLASALLVMVLRVHFQRRAPQEGLLRLLSQRQTARAVIAMLEDPARAWSLDDLAATANTSRATLVRDFRKLAQVAPLEFLAELRLGLARQSLSASNRPLADIAVEAGYQSQSAFSRAFQRRFNLAPSEIRQSHVK